MPNIDLETARTETVTPTQLEERKSRFRRVTSHAQGILEGVVYMIDEMGAGKGSQAAPALAAFDEHLAASGIDRKSLDYKLATDRFRNSLGKLVGGLRGSQIDKHKNGEVD